MVIETERARLDLKKSSENISYYRIDRKGNSGER